MNQVLALRIANSVLKHIIVNSACQENTMIKRVTPAKRVNPNARKTANLAFLQIYVMNAKRDILLT